MASFRSPVAALLLCVLPFLAEGAPKPCNPGVQSDTSKWMCLPPSKLLPTKFAQTPVRWVGKHPECASLNPVTHECWKDPAVSCKTKLDVIKALPCALPTLACGPQNQALFKSDGYTTSFCSAMVAQVNPLGGVVLQAVGKVTSWSKWQAHFGMCDECEISGDDAPRDPTPCEKVLELVATGDHSLLVPRMSPGGSRPATCPREFRDVSCPSQFSECAVDPYSADTKQKVATAADMDPPPFVLSADGLTATSAKTVWVMGETDTEGYIPDRSQKSWYLSRAPGGKTVMYELDEYLQDCSSICMAYWKNTRIEYKVISGCLFGIGKSALCNPGYVPVDLGQPKGCKK